MEQKKYDGAGGKQGKKYKRMRRKPKKMIVKDMSIN
jgi:hypothetical protein